MLKRAMFASGVLLFAFAAVSAQKDDTAKQEARPLLSWKTSGDTAETFKAEFTFGGKIDQSTPEALINTHSQLSDNRDEHNKSGEALMKAANKAIDKTLDGVRKSLFTEEVLKGLDGDTDEESEANYKRGAAVITAQSDGPNGSKLVETSQKSSHRYRPYDPESGEQKDEWITEENESKMRFTCVKGEDGKWRIDALEEWSIDWDKWDGDGEPVHAWRPGWSIVHFLPAKGPKAPGPEPELKQDTPENAALALFSNYFARREAWTEVVQHAALKGWAEAITGLYTDNGRKNPMGDDDSDDSDDMDDSPARVVDKVTDGEGGVKKVLFKPQYEWAEPVEIHVKKKGEVWQIVGAGYYTIEWTMDGQEIGEFVKLNSLLELRWR